MKTAPAKRPTSGFSAQALAALCLLAALALSPVLAPVLAPALAADGFEPTPTGTARGNLTSGKVLSFTDLHFDPFANPNLVPELAKLSGRKWGELLDTRSTKLLGKYGGDCDYRLFASMLENAKFRLSNPDFILFSGDILCHNFGKHYSELTNDQTETGLRGFILNTVIFFASTVAETFPNSQVFFTLGNNDAYNGDYALEDRGDFLRQTANPFFEFFIKDRNSKADFLATYPEHGYYSVRLPKVGGGRLISLSSVFFSPKHRATPFADSESIELNWLEAQLKSAQAAGEKVWLMTHIPPSIDAYASIHAKPKTVDLQWRAEPQERFLRIMRTYADAIVFAQAGHTHMDDFRLLFPEGKQTGALDVFHISPSVSPVFGNNPGFQIYTYSPVSGQVTDIQTHTLDLPYPMPTGWWSMGYDFNDVYLERPTAGGYETIYQEVPVDSGIRSAYIRFYSGDTHPPAIASDWKAYWCATGALTKSEYEAQCADVLQ